MTTEKEAQLTGIFNLAHFDFNTKLSAYAHFKVQNRSTCDDLVQDTFMKTWVFMVKGGKIDAMKAFLYHILNNLIVDEYRKRKTVSLDLLLEKGFDPGESELEKLFDSIDGKAALISIKSLPEKYQAIMRMRFVRSMSLEEISIFTGLSKNTIAVQTHRGLEKLKILYLHQ